MPSHPPAMPSHPPAMPSHPPAMPSHPPAMPSRVYIDNDHRVERAAASSRNGV